MKNARTNVMVRMTASLDLGTNLSSVRKLVARRRLAFRLQRSKRDIFAAIGPVSSLTFIRAWGNRGDDLIEAGVRALLAPYNVNEVSGRDLGDASGKVAVIGGGGAWCQSYHHAMPTVLQEAEKRFEHVVLLPSSFEITVPSVRDALACSKAVVFARERTSFEAIRTLCNARLAHDCAFYFDFSRYQKAGSATLNAFRTDRESALLPLEVRLPSDNIDISLVAQTMESWLDLISQHQFVRTDRAHVVLAAAMLNKTIEYTSSNYHKVSGIVTHSLTGFPISRLSIGEIDPLYPRVRTENSPADERVE